MAGPGTDNSFEQVQVERALSTLEQQAAVLEKGALRTILTVLREKLISLEIHAQPRTAQRKQITVLFATVSGFTRVAEGLSDTGMLDLMNLLWGQLGSAIREQGGTIDKYMGDGVMGLFGVPVVQEDDPVRALRAALSMRAALADFLRDLRDAPLGTSAGRPAGAGGWQEELHQLQVRIGINTGPVLLGQVGTTDEYTVIGDAVNVARRLEQSAPSGGILIAHDTFLLVQGLFDVEPVGPVAMKGRLDPVPAYLVLGVRRRASVQSSRGVEGIQTRMVGRDVELAQLQEVVHQTLQSRQGRLLTVLGEAGVGKTRLVHEFRKWVRSLARPGLLVLKGRSEQRQRPLPYTLIRDLIVGIFRIRDSDRAALAEEKLVQGMEELMALPPAEIRQRGRAIGQLIGLGSADGGAPAHLEPEALQLRDRVFQYVGDLFAAITARSPATILILEDIHWSDRESIDLIKQISRQCRQAPLLIVCLARIALFEKDPTWLTDNPEGVLHDQITLQPLSEGDSHRLVRHILRKLPDIPAELVDTIVERAEGNPFYVEELVKVLVEDGLIIPEQASWRLRVKLPQRLRIPPTLTGVLQARLDRLSSLERTTLQKAAVVGRVFWDRSIQTMRDESGHVLTENETLIALQALERRELIFRRQTSLFAGTQAYIFKHAMLRDVAYESVLLRQRPVYHKQVADWLVDQSGDRVAESASAIGEHYELAGEYVDAARWYDVAAAQAQERYNPELAIDYYRKVLLLLSEHPELTVELLGTQEKLGQLLELQARLVEAAQIYMLMRHTAELDGDLEAQTRACIGLAGISLFQANYVSVLGHVAQAEQIAWLVNAEIQLVDVQLHKAQVYVNQLQPIEGVGVVRQALSLSQKLALPAQLIRSLTLLCRIYMQLGQADELSVSLGQLQQEVLQLAEKESLQSERALGLISLGRLYLRMGRVQRASRYLLDSLALYREQDDSRGVSETLNVLGDVARLQQRLPEAVRLYRQALQIGDSIGDRQARLTFQSNLAAALVRQEAYAEAAALLGQTIQAAENVSRVVNWWGLARAYVLLAEARLGLGQAQAAQTAVLRAHELANAHYPAALPAVWRVLGGVLAATGERLTVGGQSMTAETAFSQGMRWLRERGGLDGLVEQLYLLQSWAAYEADRGRHQQAQQLQQRARSLSGRLGLETAA